MPTAFRLPSFQTYLPLAFNGVRLIVILIAAFVATALAGRFIGSLNAYAVRRLHRNGDVAASEAGKRAATVSGMVRNVVVALIWVMALLMALKEMNFDVRPLLAGAGVAGVALGLGAQSLIKDVIGGLFLLLDNQIRLNDVVVVNGTGGVVEEMNLRTTLLRGENGAVHIFPNGSIQTLSNLTRGYSYYMFEIGIDYNEDTDRAIEALKEVAGELLNEDPYRAMILEPLDVFGVDKLADSAVIVKARIKTLPIKQWAVGREMNRRIKKKFEREGIGMPFPSQTIHLADAPALGLGREEIKAIVREVLAEKDKSDRPPA